MEMSETQRRRTKFWKKFLRLTRGRVTVMRALEVIAFEERDAQFQATIRELRKVVEQGQTLSEGMDKHPEEFSACIRELIKTAEKTGAWDEILMEIAEGLEEGTFE